MSKYSITQAEVNAGARALFLTIQVHQTTADAIGLTWDAMPMAVRAPWIKATRAVLKAAQEAGEATT